MVLSAFPDKSSPPSPAELQKTLGPAATRWADLLSSVAVRHAPITEKWAFAGANFGWSLRLLRKDRILVYLTPQTGHFLMGVVLGEKAAALAQAPAVPAQARALVEQAPRYAEGRGIRLVVASPEDLRTAQVLVELKTGT
jgi:hypothetical protein